MNVSDSYDPIMQHMNLLAPPPKHIDDERKEGNEGYITFYREGQSKAFGDKYEFIRKLEYERILGRKEWSVPRSRYIQHSL